MATCYSIITKHDGTITVESEQGEGAVFHIYLPRTEDVNNTEEINKTSSHTGSGKILILDDESFFRDIVRRMLESMGYEIVESASGEEVIECCKIQQKKKQSGELSSNLFAAAFFDLTIPGKLGGKDIIETVRQFCPHIPIFAVSGYSADDVMSNPQKYGFTASIPKPFRKKDLEDILSTYLKKSNT